jgi:hypothetical protein
MSEVKTPNEKLRDYLNLYLGYQNDTRGDELEVRFGTKKHITQIQFDDVIDKLKSVGFTTENPQGKYHMNVQSEFVDPRSGLTKISNVRTEIAGFNNIQQYCKTNTLDTKLRAITFTQKIRKMVDETFLQPIDYHDFGFRVNYKKEIALKTSSRMVVNTLENWNETKKVFRLLKRFTFYKDNFPLKIDCSIIKSSNRRGKRLVPEYRVETSGVFENQPLYEIEIEVLKNGFPTFLGTSAENILEKDNVLRLLKKTIKFILSGLQKSNFPISISEQNGVLDNYMNLIHQGQRGEDKRVSSRNFVGFSSVSLELQHIIQPSEDSDIPNIREPYTVTEKADGMRKLLYIDKGGKVYLIDVNMNIQFTGMVSGNLDYHESLLDGEHVLHDKTGNYINYYMAFDAYYIARRDIRSLPLAVIPEGSKSNKTRAVHMHDIVSNAAFQAIIGERLPLTIQEKTFYLSNSEEIFQNCNAILSKVKDGLFVYETDGLMFTPSDKGVGSNTINEVLPPKKMTWDRSFKWKPPEFNTIDFLVTTQKTESGEDFVGNIFQEGISVDKSSQLTQYKTLILRVGFSERMHGYLNPCEDIIQGNIPDRHDRDNRDKYKPVPFYPTEPRPNYPAYLCNIVLEESDGVKYMLIEDHKEYFEDGTIVEFRFDGLREPGYQWVPIRVRKKKTAEYKAGKNNFGNAYHVASSVWRSIHNPITERMVRTGADIPSDLTNDDVYYNNKKNSTITRALRDFHNLFVKRILILNVSNRGDTLMDQSVGKGGDIPKWITAKLSFVFGIDISLDNIENRINGVCSRYLNYRKKWKIMPDALFVRGDSGENIRSGRACFTDKNREIVNAVFGEGPKDEVKLGPGVYKQYGKGKDGFDIISNQFSIHYFFENKTRLNGFLRNVSECCKVGGHFIGTSYDGTKVFRALENKTQGEGIRIMSGENKMWEITKQYTSDAFENNESCLGYKIDVYQESINKVFPEYLVNYDYFIELIEQYGFVLLTSVECQDIGLTKSIGNFDLLFNEMQKMVKSRQIRKTDIGSAVNMNTDEKKISFLNKYFIFKKIRDVNAEEIEKNQLNTTETNEVIVSEEKKDAPKKIKKMGKLKLSQVKKASKLKKLKKIKLKRNPKKES